MPLPKLATTRAAARAKKVTATRAHHWKVAIGAKPEESSTRKPTPTCVAYRFLRDPTGWQHSPVGKQAEQDQIPEARAQDDSNTEEENDAKDDVVYEEAVAFIP